MVLQQLVIEWHCVASSIKIQFLVQFWYFPSSKSYLSTHHYSLHLCHLPPGTYPLHLHYPHSPTSFPSLCIWFHASPAAVASHQSLPTSTSCLLILLTPCNCKPPASSYQAINPKPWLKALSHDQIFLKIASWSFNPPGQTRCLSLHLLSANIHPTSRHQSCLTYRILLTDPLSWTTLLSTPNPVPLNCTHEAPLLWRQHHLPSPAYHCVLQHNLLHHMTLITDGQRPNHST